jgi:hypothetical protein
MGSLRQPLQPGTVLRFGSLEFMSLDGSYDMVLLPPQRDSNNGRRLARRRRTRRRLPIVAKRNTRCWGPSASKGPQKHDLTMFLEYNT